MAGDEVREWAESGIVALTGRSDGPPLVPPGRAASVARAHTRRIAEVTSGQVRLDGARVLSERAAYTGGTRAGSVSVGGACRLLRSADGWAAISCARADDPLLLGAMIGEEIHGDPWPAVTDWVSSHTAVELAERTGMLGIAGGPVHPVLDSPPTPLGPRPVEGLTVVDFSSLWAGPLCAHILGLAGARVVKVETPSRPDGARRGNTGFYELLHAGHESVVLDPADDTERRELHELVAAADIVIEASRPRALAGFGLDAEQFVAAGKTWISITAYGRDSDRVGFGDDISATAVLLAHDENGPVFVGDALADPLTGLTASVLAMSAPPDGRGVLWDVSMASVVAATLHDDIRPIPYLEGGRWRVDTSSGAVDIDNPAPRPADLRLAGTTSESGSDTARVLKELGIR